MERRSWAYDTPVYEQVVAQRGFDPLVRRAGRELGGILARRLNGNGLGLGKLACGLRGIGRLS